MGATTPTYGLRYLQLPDPPDIPKLGQQLAEDIEAQIVRLDALLAAVQPVTAWASYTPSVQNIGSGTFTTQTGRWKRHALKTVTFGAFLAVGTAGTGSGTLSFNLPTAPARTIRQVFHGATGDSPNLQQLEAISFTGGTGVIVDRILLGSAYMVGSDLLAGRILTIGGTYEEA